MENLIQLLNEVLPLNTKNLLEQIDKHPSFLSEKKTHSSSTSPHSINGNIPIFPNTLNHIIESTLTNSIPPNIKNLNSPSIESKETINISPCSSSYPQKKENNNNVILQCKRKRKKRSRNNTMQRQQTTQRFNNKKKILPMQNQTPFIKQMLLIYPEEKYLDDINKIEKGSLEFFMKENFSSMFSHSNYYSFSVCFKERRKNNSEIFINNSMLKNNKDNFFLFNHNSLNEQEECIKNIPKKIWSPPNKEIDYHDFYNKCIQIWPFNECCFVKEFALEFLMMNDYDINKCLTNLEEFVVFSKEKTKENNIPAIRTDAKIIKNYSLRLKKKG